MSNGAKVALAVGAGYLLGRTRKMKLALMLAGAGITGKFPARPADLAARGLQSLGGSEQLGQLKEQLRVDMLGAARSAALTAVTHQVDSINDRLQGVTSAVGADEALDEVGTTVGDTVNTAFGRRRTPSADDEYLDGDDAYDESPDDEGGEPLAADEIDDLEDYEDLDETDIDETDIDEEPEPEEKRSRPSVTRRGTTRRATPPRASIRRSSRTASQEEPPAMAARHQHTERATKRPVRRGR